MRYVVLSASFSSLIYLSMALKHEFNSAWSILKLCLRNCKKIIKDPPDLGLEVEVIVASNLLSQLYEQGHS